MPENPPANPPANLRDTSLLHLTRHFFRRFFENDIIQSGQDTQTTVIRALSAVAAPGLMFAFWLQNQYVRRTSWGRVEDEYFFVMFSFVVMAAVAIFEWEMLFPDRLDFLVLTPLSLPTWQMPAAKVIALAMFLGLFVIASSIFGDLMLPAVTADHLFRQIAAQTLATLSAGVAGAAGIMLLGGILLCVLPLNLFRSVSLIFRMLAVTALGLIVIHYARFGDAMQPLLTNPSAPTLRWLPTFWFLGLYQTLQHGAAAPAFAAPMAHRASLALALIAAGLLVIYPLAWTRMRRLAIEDQPTRAHTLPAFTRGAIHALIRSPQQRAIFHFIGQTIARNTRYQVYMALYFGAGLALAISCATHVTTVRGVPHAALSTFGLHAVMPLLVFWTIAGLKLAFAFPLQLGAAWIFRTTGAPLPTCVRAVRKWVLGCGLAVVLAVAATLAFLRCTPRDLAVQTICGICLCALLVEGLFFEQATIPFSQPRRPGRTQMPLMLTLHLGVLAPFVFLMILLELRIERTLPLLLLPIALVPAVHWVAEQLRDRAVLIEEER
ncbi:MAG TPA: hypothetical protein VGN43_06205, partial [Steroidobacteraceae bacterium]|nr:hypothetical protein [Steroidobacteraceae bacterium]